MNMSTGIVNRAISCALLGFILSSTAAFAQRGPNRQKARVERKTAQFVPNRYILFLQDQPVTGRFTSREQFQTAAAVAYRQQLEARQQTVIRDLASRHIQVA